MNLNSIIKIFIAIFSILILTQPVMSMPSSPTLPEMPKTLDEILGTKKPDIKLASLKKDKLVTYSLNKYSDINYGKWYTDSVAKMIGLDAISGAENGIFKPDSPISVAEFLKLILSTTGNKQLDGAQVWYSNYIIKAYDIGVLSSDDSYNFNQPLKRSEMAKLICKLLKINPDTTKQPLFDDVSNVEANWVNPAFTEMLIRGYIINGKNSYRPQETVTRAQACAAAERMLLYKQDPENYKKSRSMFLERENKRQDILYKAKTKQIPVAKEIPVILYHHLLKDEENVLYRNNESVLSLQVFEEQMKLLFDNGYFTPTLSELEKFINGQLELPEKSVVITFDDGYLSNYLYAYPILKEYGFKAAEFLVSQTIQQESSKFDPSLLQILSWSEINASSDVFEYHCHTHYMHGKTNGKALLVASSESEIINDLSCFKALIPSPYISYPYGEFNQNTINYIKSVGFRMGFTTQGKKITKNNSIYEIGRYSIFPKSNIDGFKKIVGLK